MRRTLMWVGVGVGACGGSSGDGLPESCDVVADRTGTYLFQYRERSGDCGPIPEQLGQIDNSNNAMLPDGCAFDTDDIVRDNGCTLERAYTCTMDGERSSWVAVTTQKEADGSLITGIVSVRFDDGVRPCVSTYDIRATRQ